MSSRFDELAKGLARGMSRREALRWFSGGLAGVTLGLMGAGKAWSQDPGTSVCADFCMAVLPALGCPNATAAGDLDNRGDCVSAAALGDGPCLACSGDTTRFCPGGKFSRNSCCPANTYCSSATPCVGTPGACICNPPAAGPICGVFGATATSPGIAHCCPADTPVCCLTSSTSAAPLCCAATATCCTNGSGTAAQCCDALTPKCCRAAETTACCRRDQDCATDATGAACCCSGLVCGGRCCPVGTQACFFTPPGAPPIPPCFRTEIVNGFPVPINVPPLDVCA